MKNMRKTIGWFLVVVGFLWLVYFSVSPAYKKWKYDKGVENGSINVTHTYFKEPVDPEIANESIKLYNELSRIRTFYRIIALAPATLMLIGAFLISYQKKKEED
jgi:hypothetical protein